MEKVGRVQIEPDFQDQIPKTVLERKLRETKGYYGSEIKKVEQGKASSDWKEKRVVRLKEMRSQNLGFACRDYYNSRLTLAMGNIASFYSAVFNSLFPGSIMRRFKTEKEALPNGEEINFHPDHIKYEGRRKIFTEIKSVSIRNSKPWCSDRQLENYCFDLLRDAEQPLFEPQLDYAFFRYGRGKKRLVKPNKAGNQELARVLAGRTADLLVVPSNFLFLMMLASNNVAMNQTTNKGPDEANYWKIYGHLISQLHKGTATPIDLAGSVKSEFDLRKELCLDGLECTRTESPDNLYYAIFRVKPFAITRYQNRDSAAWLEHFRTNHHRILTDILGIRDIYHDSKGVPF